MKDKVVLVTGASKGIGKQIAKTFLRQGSFVILVSWHENYDQCIIDHPNSQILKRMLLVLME